MPSFRDKVFVITGASSGLGQALAAAFAEAGAAVVLAARGAEALQSVAGALHDAGHQALAVPADVTDQQQVEALMARAVERFGRIDGLINNAGVSMRGTALETTPEDFQRLLELNLIAAVRCARAASEQLLARGGHLVNIGSLSGKAASRYLGAYPASKFALTAYTQQLRLELSPRGVHVLLVSPGPIARPKSRTYGAESREQLPDSARKPGGGVRAKAIPPDELARRIVEACRRRRAELTVPGTARLLFALMQLSPRLGDYLVRRMTGGDEV